VIEKTTKCVVARLYIITETERNITTVLLPEEY
jgi:hypothetical protein